MGEEEMEEMGGDGRRWEDMGGEGGKGMQT
jgi:hypothetical protein